MKKWLRAWGLVPLLGVAAWGQPMSSISDVPPPVVAPAGDPAPVSALRAWILAQPLNAGMTLTLDGSVRAVTFLTGPSFGSKGWGLGQAGRAYVDFDAGGSWKPGVTGRILVAPMFHVANVIQAVWEHLPFDDRIRLPALPPIELGPMVYLPTGYVWTFRNSTGGMLYAKF